MIKGKSSSKLFNDTDCLLYWHLYILVDLHFLGISYPIIMFQSYYCCFSVLKLALLILFFNWIVKYDLNSMWLSLMDCISCCLCLIGNREIEVNVVDGKIQLFHILENLEHPSLLKISFLGSSPVKGFEFMSTFISHSFKNQLISRIIYISA